MQRSWICSYTAYFTIKQWYYDAYLLKGMLKQTIDVVLQQL